MRQPEDDSVRLSHLDRVLWPATGFTKGDLVDYYARIGRVLVPHLAGRPLMLGRWPEGIDRRGWGQWECRGRPAWMRTAPLLMRTGKTVDVCVVEDLRSLVWLANQGVIELHPYLARASSFDVPTGVVFDLDPGPPAGVRECCSVALRLRDLLAKFGLDAVVKLSGGAGLHVVVPLNTPVTYDRTKTFAREVARRLAADDPTVTDRPLKADRAGRVFIDWAQNDQRKQTVAVYSVRATARPAVSAPLRWSEVEAGSPDPEPPFIGPREVVERAERHGDLFRAALELRQQLP